VAARAVLIDSLYPSHHRGGRELRDLRICPTTPKAAYFKGKDVSKG
jgi:hypothetical protein